MELHAQGLCSLNFFLMRNIFVFEMCGREPSIIIIIRHFVEVHMLDTAL